MDEEIQAINKNKTWQLVDLPKGCKAIGVKWVYKLKKDVEGNVVKHKAWLVVKGFNQQAGIDFNEVFAPVVRMETVRLLIAMAARMSWKIFQMDFKSTFLNGVLKEDVYIQQPPGYVNASCEKQVLKLNKALYGLKQAPRTWNQTLDTFLLKLGFVRCPHEYALYVKHEGSLLLMLCVYVDDILITGSATNQIEEFKRVLTQQFEMTDLGEMSYYLGIRVEQAPDGIFLSQQSYINKVLHQFHMFHCKPVSTPLSVGVKIGKAGNGESVDGSMYRSLVGSLRYITCTRPDIVYAVGLVCRFMDSPTVAHMALCKRVLRYLKGTSSFDIWYCSSSSSAGNLSLSGFSDSDWAGDLDCKKSTTGFLVCLDQLPFTWVSKLQPIVALSSSEAEYIAAAACVSHVLWLRQLLKELHCEQKNSTVVYVDNQSAISISKNPVYHDRSKNIDVKFHFLRESIANEVVKLVHVKTTWQILLTKPLPTHMFVKFRELLGIVDSSLRGAYVTK
ncbi:hypothetical protein Dimus_038384 [Dionaea muscipula]